MPDNVTEITVEVSPNGGQKTKIVAGDQTQEVENAPMAAEVEGLAAVGPAGGQKTKVVITITTGP
jgi:hypothetical protein